MIQHTFGLKQRTYFQLSKDWYAIIFGIIYMTPEVGMDFCKITWLPSTQLFKLLFGNINHDGCNVPQPGWLIFHIHWAVSIRETQLRSNQRKHKMWKVPLLTAISNTCRIWDREGVTSPRAKADSSKLEGSFDGGAISPWIGVQLFTWGVELDWLKN